ncbi:MAG: hypothetical protein A2831_01840 [Candidatus Yanofskybacteria bacterium RIFCSPHIGHO2_01_FULL_44_17]|uniref:Uncharacterized protein n=1 Tax=Candidatus Yanofskybacteria bacterium RIFCSPHIGHO2_01_FULL_44_17 TaxID=1802668 RepID=A0A1F8EV73_9BACT|nr:MAG: hypothetical protein A2831_01840 [Candidatus Yanofskybacteria bacterium RIFCSPHIGHO2_01_FULL_44_17]
MNKGSMPNTDFTYEGFEGLLASFYLSLLPLHDSGDVLDKQDFETALGILNGFAKRHKVQKPQNAVAHTRPTSEEWGQPKKFDSCFTLLDMMGSFWRDFGVGTDPKKLDGQERNKLGRLLIGLLDRHGVLKAKFDTLDGQQVAVGVESWTKDREFQSLA